ncbi:somatostatin receptor type 5-like [Diadema setosum]|uniref:somatostatin receptor type 5-like n=1 Tax=Diadema setosum TaxID=31175 RepID=UPI003B3BBA00
MDSISDGVYGGNVTVDEDGICHAYRNVTVEQLDLWLYGPGLTLFCELILPFIFTVGLLSNLAFIYATLRVPRMRNPTNCYLTNLAVTDILFLLIRVGSDILAYIISPVSGDTSYLGWHGYVYFMFVIHTAYFASLFFITLVTFDRYNAVCRPMTTRHSGRRRRAAISSTSSWIVSTLLSATLFIPGVTYRYSICLTWPNTETTRHLPHAIIDSYISDYFVLLKVVPFLLALVLNTTMFVKIVYELRAAASRLRAHGDVRERANRRVIRMVIVNGIAFFVLLGPFEINATVHIIAKFFGPYHFRPAYRVINFIAFTLTYLNSVVNPFIYTIMSKTYRDCAKEAFCLDRCCETRKTVEPIAV